MLDDEAEMLQDPEYLRPGVLGGLAVLVMNQGGRLLPTGGDLAPPGLQPAGTAGEPEVRPRSSSFPGGPG
jgi:hypothetical protein